MASKLVYRTGGGGGGGRGGAAAAPARPVALFIVDADRNAPQAGARARGRHAADVSRAEGGVQADLQRGLAQPARLPLRAQHARHRLAGDDSEMYGKLLPYVNHRADLNYLLDIMGAEIAIGHSYVRGGDMPDVPSRRPAACSARTSRSRTAATRSRASTTPRAGIRICARRSRRRASTSTSATTSSRSTASSCGRRTTSIGCSTARRTVRPCSRSDRSPRWTARAR